MLRVIISSAINYKPVNGGVVGDGVGLGGIGCCGSGTISCVGGFGENKMHHPC